MNSIFGARAQSAARRLCSFWGPCHGAVIARAGVGGFAMPPPRARTRRRLLAPDKSSVLGVSRRLTDSRTRSRSNCSNRNGSTTSASYERRIGSASHCVSISWMRIDCLPPVRSSISSEVHVVVLSEMRSVTCCARSSMSANAERGTSMRDTAWYGDYPAWRFGRANCMRGGKERRPCDTQSLLIHGSGCWTRTSDPLINSQLLYQLS